MRHTSAVCVLACISTLALSACSSSFGSTTAAKQDTTGRQKLTVTIGSSGNAETAAVQAATAAWAHKTGNSVTVIPAQNLDQQLGQAFAGGKPPDVFYGDTTQFANYAKGGSLYAYGDQISGKSDFSPQLLKTFSYKGKPVCIPKDTSTLALAINTQMWKKAGLSDADIPKNWNQLESVARKLTKGSVTGLVVDASYNELGAFMRQAGGWVTNRDQTKVTADTPQNLTALKYVQKLLREGVLKFPKQVDAGWGGEALGTQKAAMTIEGNWLDGAMKSDYPSVAYKVVDLPVGPAGKGTLAFSNCWAVSTKSAHHRADVDLVKYLSTASQQMKFAKAFGVMPSRKSALAQYEKAYPADKAFVDGAAYAQGPVTLPGFDKVLSQFDSELGSLATANAKKILSDLQTTGDQALKGQS
jgi:multiple sugar transport system substrate-binding protein